MSVVGQLLAVACLFQMLAYIKLGRLEEALNMLQQILARWKKKTPIVFPDVVCCVLDVISSSNCMLEKKEYSSTEIKAAARLYQ